MTARLTTLPDTLRGGAWPSPARAVRRPVKSGNERDPHPQLLSRSSDREHTEGTAADKAEEGGGHGRSACPESPGLHAGYNGGDSGCRPRKGEVIPETPPWLGSRAETRPRERGIPSNRASTSRGEYVPAPCTHRPSLHPSEGRVRHTLSPVTPVMGCVKPSLRKGGEVVTR
jgi:hypothetical protein